MNRLSPNALNRIRWFSSGISLIFLCHGPLASEEKPDRRRIHDKPHSVFSISFNNSDLSGDGSAQVIFAAWSDGHVVWSKDRMRGGKPFYQAEIGGDSIQQFLDRLEMMGAFDKSTPTGPGNGADSSFLRIRGDYKGRHLSMDSSHELYESNGNWVGTSHGITLLRERSRWDVLRQQSPAYLCFRLIWSDIRLATVNLIPREGTETKDSVIVDRSQAVVLTSGNSKN